MKVLLSAIACHPEYGSESAVGWKAALALARSNTVSVLTHTDNREGIERYVKREGLTNPSFTYFGTGGLYHPNRLLARGQSWFRYFAWMRESLAQGRKLFETQHFDLVHHVTYSTYRVASPLWELGLPLVFGPVGGGERLPWIAAGSMSWGQRMHERIRLLANTAARFSVGVRRTVQNASVLIASNQATARTLHSIAGNMVEIRVLPVVFFTDDQIQDIRKRPKTYSEGKNCLEVFSSGMLEGRKGLSIALHAVRLAIDAGLSIRFTIPSRGPEFSHLRQLTVKLGLSDVVRFPDSLPRDEYWNTLLSADVYMAPSLRDNCPATLLEAMLARCVPIVASCNGPGEIVTEDIGEVVQPAAPDVMAHDVCQKLVALASNRLASKIKAQAASDFVARNFTQGIYLATIASAYEAALTSRRT
jgi:glycosyltransferase involved in cell wall biosynthesis